MNAIEFVDVATARAARGIRIVASGLVPSPWSEAAKGLFRVQGIPVRVVRAARDDADLAAWTRADNVPVVFHDDEPPRLSWAAITTLAARLGAPGALLPEDLERRARTIGLLHEIAGEDGLGWSGRLQMIHASFTSNGERGFPLPVATYLAGRYGYAPERVEPARARAREVLAALADRLGGGRAYLDGDRVGALDVYAATFLTPLCPIPEADCPRLSPRLRAAFGAAHEALGAAVPPELIAHRSRMYERHLGWPIAI
jgi:glutathione S-transferase